MGSACSILALDLQQKDSIFKEYLEQGPQGEPGLAYLLGAPITLDSFFFRENLKNNKWFDEDLVAYQYLSNYADIGEDFYNRLSSIFGNIDMALNLGLKVLNVRDYKIYDLQIGKLGVPMSTVPIQRLFDHFGHEEFFHQADSLLEENSLGLYAMITKSEGGNKIEILLYRPNASINTLTDKYEELATALQDFEEWELANRQDGTAPNDGRYVWWDIQNKNFDRKKFEKFVKEKYTN